MGAQVLLVLAHALDFFLLLIQQFLGLLQLGVLVLQPINLRLQLIRLLVFNEFHVAYGDFLQFLEAGVAESVTLQTNLRQSTIPVKRFKEHRLDILREKVVGQPDRVHLIIRVQCIDNQNESSIVQFAI